MGDDKQISTDHVIFRIYETLPQLGPGDDASTERALSLLPDLPPNPKILDVGCGTGRQSLALARLSRGHVTAVDIYEPFVAQLRESAQQAGLADQIQATTGNMAALEFAAGTFDLIWSEGAIYLMGFATGLQAWRPLLKRDGLVAVTEVSWLVDDPPQGCRHYWEREYPAIASIPTNLDRVRESGYEPLGHFALPASSWWEPYYVPLLARIDRIEPELRGDSDAEAVIQGVREEVDLFRAYSDTYGYVFYLMRRSD